MEKKVLITGIDSFTGTHLSSYLSSCGYEVYGTSLFGGKEKVYKCNINNQSEFETVLKTVKPDFFIHLAAISFVRHEPKEDFYKINTIAVANLIESFVKLNINPKKIVIASSATVYGNLGIEILSEDLCPSPANHYGASKLAMEFMVKNYFDKLPIVILRPFNYTGIGQSENFLIPKIVSHYKNRKRTIELGNLDVIREFNDISFVCEAYKRVLESNTDSKILNLCSSRGIKLMDIISIMNRLANYEIEIKINPKFVRKNEIKKLIGSSKLLFETIGEIKQPPIEETLKVMYEA